MMLFLILMLLYSTTAEELVEESQMPHCNYTRTIQFEEPTTEPPPPFPMTSFTCWGRYDGYYADVEVDCTIFHYCQTWHFPTGLNETVKWDFACPPSTIFNQKILSCTPPNISFDCQESPNYYWVNYNLTFGSSTTTPTPTPDFSTSVPNVGQQLIIGELQEHSASFPDSVQTAASELPTESSVSELPDAPSGFEQPTFPSAAEVPNAPSFSEQPNVPSELPTFSSDPEVPSVPSGSQLPPFPSDSELTNTPDVPASAFDLPSTPYVLGHPATQSVRTNAPISFPNSNFVESGSGFSQVSSKGNETDVINFPM